MQAKSKSAAMLAGTCRYDIELCDTSTERDVFVNHKLVIAGHAQATLEYHKVNAIFRIFFIFVVIVKRSDVQSVE